MLIQRKPSRKILLKVGDAAPALQPLLDYYDELERSGLSFEMLSSQRIREYQLHALNVTLRHAWKHNDFYRHAFIQAGLSKPEIADLGEMTRIPFLSKDDIRGEKSKLLCCDRREVGQVHVNFGSTGGPIYTSFTLNDQYVYELLPKYTQLFPENEQDVVAVALPYEFALPGLGFQRLYQFAFGSMVLSLGKGSYMAPVDQSLELMKEFRASVMATTPSYAVMLAEEADKLGMDLRREIGLKRIILTGEGCSPTFRERLEHIWGCEVSFFYGSSECGVIGIECSEHSGYHVAQGHVIVEIVEPNTGRLLDDGEVGEIVVTTLLREGMPMIRYRSGEIGYLQQARCSCGNPLEIIHLRGRQENQIMLDREMFSPFMLEHYLLQVPEVGFWYHFKITATQKLIIEIEPYQTNMGDRELSDKVSEHMKEKLHIDCDIRVLPRLPRAYGKATRIVFDED